MPRKLRGAAAAAVRKAKRRRATTKRKNPARKRTVRKRTATKRANPTRRRKAPARRRTTRATPRRRRRTTTRARRNPSRRYTTARRRTVRKNPTRRRRVRRNPPPLTAAQRKKRRHHISKYKAIKHRGASVRRASAPKYRYTPTRIPKSLRKSRRTVLYQRAYGSTASQKFMRDYKLRSNPMQAITHGLRMAAPIFGAMVGAKFLAAKLNEHAMKAMGDDQAAENANKKSNGEATANGGKFDAKEFAIAGGAAVGMIGLAALITRKGMLAKYRQPIIMGASIAAVDTIARHLIPPNVKKQIGMSGAEDIYDSALSEYVQVGEYVEIGNYEEEGYNTSLDDYVSIGAEEELGALEQEMGLEQELGMVHQDLGAHGGAMSQQIGTGIGAGGRTASMVRGVPARSFSAPVPSRSFVRPVPGITENYDNMSKLYSGIFAGGYGC